MTIKLHTQNFGGNIHEAATTINKWGWAEYLFHLHSVSSTSTVAVFKMPAAKVHEIRASSVSYVADPHHDDYDGPADPYASDYRLSQVLQTVDHAIIPHEAPQSEPVAQAATIAQATPEPEAPAKPARKTKPKAEPEKPVQQAVEKPPETPVDSTTGIDPNAATKALSNDLPDWAK